MVNGLAHAEVSAKSKASENLNRLTQWLAKHSSIPTCCDELLNISHHFPASTFRIISAQKP
jgi:hypothetical protein